MLNYLTNRFLSPKLRTELVVWLLKPLNMQVAVLPIGAAALITHAGQLDTILPPIEFVATHPTALVDVVLVRAIMSVISDPTGITGMREALEDAATIIHDKEMSTNLNKAFAAFYDRGNKNLPVIPKFESENNSVSKTPTDGDILDKSRPKRTRNKKGNGDNKNA